MKKSITQLMLVAALTIGTTGVTPVLAADFQDSEINLETKILNPEAPTVDEVLAMNVEVKVYELLSDKSWKTSTRKLSKEDILDITVIGGGATWDPSAFVNLEFYNNQPEGYMNLEMDPFIGGDRSSSRSVPLNFNQDSKKWEPRDEEISQVYTKAPYAEFQKITKFPFYCEQTKKVYYLPADKDWEIQGGWLTDKNEIRVFSGDFKVDSYKTALEKAVGSSIEWTAIQGINTGEVFEDYFEPGTAPFCMARDLNDNKTWDSTIDVAMGFKTVATPPSKPTPTPTPKPTPTPTPTPPASAERSVMHRLYNPNSGEHFYTSNDGEKNHLVSVGWKYEGEGWKAPEKSSLPVYRLYNPNAGDHHYTLDKNEKDTLIKIGWNDEGIGWYSDEAKGVPLYRQYNPNAKAGSHNYTTDKNENDGLVKLGWKEEGIGWYGLK